MSAFFKPTSLTQSTRDSSSALTLKSIGGSKTTQSVWFEVEASGRGRAHPVLRLSRPSAETAHELMPKPPEGYECMGERAREKKKGRTAWGMKQDAGSTYTHKLARLYTKNYSTGPNPAWETDLPSVWLEIHIL